MFKNLEKPGDNGAQVVTLPITSLKIEVTLIRHAQSQYNLAQQKAMEAKGPDNKEECPLVRYDGKLIDCELTEEGIEQCKKASELFAKDEIALIFTSPLIRTLMTTTLIFGGHPSKPKTVILPFLKEQVYDAGDLPSDIENVKKRFPDYDFSVFSGYKQPNLWFLDEIGSNPHTETMRTRLPDGYHGPTLCDYIKEITPTLIEPADSLIKRTEKAKEFIREYVKSNGKPNGKIIIVSHGGTLWYLTGESFDERCRPIKGKFLKNCVPTPFEF
jgi:broad specificity phosphatase PhoE